MKKKEMFFAIDDECFLPTDIKGTLQKHVDEYNAMQSAEPDKLKEIVHEITSWHNVTPEEAVTLKIRGIVLKMTSWCSGLYLPYEFGGDLSVLLFAIEGRRGKKLAWGASAHSAFDGGELEICRELVFREMLEYSKGDVMNANNAYKQLIKETADDNTADILGMIIDEIGDFGDIEKMSDDDFGDLLDDFGALLVQWRALEVPKCRDEDAYELVYELIERCFDHKAFRSAIRLSGLLYAADEPKELPNLAKTNLLIGKVMYELGCLEIAKRCFMLADEETEGKCWE
ncbi:MAG: hypothetical protein K2N56_11135, partial [Oscillospiraceae bacterium]|nr:hypothetical protein [Oscillospiraceae bacterium]